MSISGVLISTVLFHACADRDRVNPVDPQNPDTQGKPTGVRVYSIADTVHLQWDLIDLEDITGYSIYRKTEKDSDFTLFATVERNRSMFIDTQITFGIAYSYEISAVGNTFESRRSDLLTITPGPTFSWVADLSQRQIVKLTNDSQHEILRAGGFQKPIDVEPNPVAGVVWVVDSFTRELLRVSQNGSIIAPRIQLTRPRDATVDFNDGSVWVGDPGEDAVVKLDSSGKVLFETKQDPVSDVVFKSPIAVAVDQTNGDCWVADSRADMVARIRSDGSEVLVAPVNFQAVQSVAVDSGHRHVWVADSSRVVRLNPSGEMDLEIDGPFDYAFKVAANDSTGDLWVLNLVFVVDASTVSKYSKDGRKEFELDGFTIPEDLSVNLYDNSCIVADTQNDRIVRVSSNGLIAGVFDAVGNPEAVGVQNQRPLDIYKED
ncbi:MAG: hypothetical protein ACE5HO_05025 [bacterium]